MIQTYGVMRVRPRSVVLRSHINTWSTLTSANFVMVAVVAHFAILLGTTRSRSQNLDYIWESTMRQVSYVLFVAVLTLFATCSVASVPTQTKLDKLSFGVADGQHQRFLRTQTGTDNNNDEERRLQNKIPPTVVKDLLATESRRKSAFEAWNEANVGVKGLAKSLEVKATRVAWFNDLMNRNKKEQVKLLKHYRDYLQRWS